MEDVIEYLESVFEDWKCECEENEFTVDSFLWIYEKLTGKEYEL